MKIHPTSDNEPCKVGDPGAAFRLGDTAVEVLVLTADFFQIEGSCEPSVVNGFGLSHRDIFTVAPLENHHTHRQTDRKGSRQADRHGVNALLKVRIRPFTPALTHTDTHSFPVSLTAGLKVMTTIEP